MGKKVSASLFRINKFNNYRNTWVFNYRLKFNHILNYYYKISKIFNNYMLLNIKNFYFNYIYQLSGKIIINKTSKQLITHFTTIYNLNKFKLLNLFVTVYKVNPSCISIPRLKLFIKFNLLKYTAVQNLYNKLYTTLLTEYLHYSNDFIGLRIIISGRLSNTKLATSETFQIGLLPLHQLDIFILYEKFYILTKYGLLGVKIWIGKK